MARTENETPIFCIIFIGTYITISMPLITFGFARFFQNNITKFMCQNEKSTIL